MDAISKIFSDNQDFRKSIVDFMIQEMKSTSFNINEYFNQMFNIETSGAMSYFCTLSYLKFMTKVFKIDFPYMILNQEGQDDFLI